MSCISALLLIAAHPCWAQPYRNISEPTSSWRPEQMFEYAEARFYGLGGARPDLDLALRWYRKSADGGEPRAMATMGMMMIDGTYLKKDIAGGIRFLKQANKKMDGAATCALGLVKSSGLDGATDSASAKSYFEKGFEIALKGANASEPRSMYLLGKLYMNGFGCQTNRSEAEKWITLAANSKYVPAMLEMGDWCFYGTMGPRDYAKAATWYTTAGVANTPSAASNLGYCLQMGVGMARDPQQAVALYTRAASLGDSMAMLRLANCLENGIGTPLNPIQAMEYYKKAASSGDALGEYLLGVHLQVGRNCQRDLAAAFKMFERSAKKGNSHGMAALGDCYLAGVTVPADHKQAMEWYNKSANSGNFFGWRALASMFRDGNGVPKDPAKAIEFLKKASDLGDGVSMNCLGLMLKNGEGTAADPFQAFQRFQNAAQKGEPLGMFNTGVCFLNGEGVAADKERAKYWLTESSNRGCTSAKQILATLTEPNGSEEALKTLLVIGALAYFANSLFDAPSPDYATQNNVASDIRRFRREREDFEDRQKIEEARQRSIDAARQADMEINYLKLQQ